MYRRNHQAVFSASTTQGNNRTLFKRSRYRKVFGNHPRRSRGFYIERLEPRLLLSVFTVNSTDLTPDSMGDDGICDTTHNPFSDPPIPANGICTLPAAISQANHNQNDLDRIRFNISGSGVKTIKADTFGLLLGPVIIDGTTQPGFSGKPIIELKGTGPNPESFDGLAIHGPGSVITGLVINEFSQDGIQLLSDGNHVFGNYIGTDATGTSAAGNGRAGIFIIDVSNNVIGGPPNIESERNVISGNGNFGIDLSGEVAGKDNIISGNLIGTDITGTIDLGNGLDGVHIHSGKDNTVENNLISGNDFNGIRFHGEDTFDNRIIGNFIGTTIDGDAPLPNGNGVHLESFFEFIGGAPGSGEVKGNTIKDNVISGNTSHGVKITGEAATKNFVISNKIGTDDSGEAPLPNGLAGVFIGSGANLNKIGIDDRDEAVGNVIAENLKEGIRIADNATIRNTIRHNSIHSNGEIGIDLEADGENANNFGVTPNDLHDGDEGPNELQNFPLVNLIEEDAAKIRIGGTISGSPETEFIIDFYATNITDAEKLEHGIQGERYIDTTTVTTDERGNVHFEVDLSGRREPNETITATATDPLGNTSEFSPFTPDLKNAQLEIRTPVMFVPGIFGTFPKSQNYNEWLANSGIEPEKLQLDPLAHVYDDLIETLGRAGYQEGVDLFLVPYDWRLPLAPAGPDSTIDGVIDIEAAEDDLEAAKIVDDTIEFGLDYLGKMLAAAGHAYRHRHGQQLAGVHVIAHSMGGLLTRSYIQSTAYGGSIARTPAAVRLPMINHVTGMGVPNRGAAKAWNIWHNNFVDDLAYRLVMSKTILHAWQKLHAGEVIQGPNGPITLANIGHEKINHSREEPIIPGDPPGELLFPENLRPEQLAFLRLWGPGVRDLLPTYDFIAFIESGVFAQDEATTNWLLRDLNRDDGFGGHLEPERYDFLDRVARTTLYYGADIPTITHIGEHVGPFLNFPVSLPKSIVPFDSVLAVAPYDDPPGLAGAEVWFEGRFGTLAGTGGVGDGTVPLESSEEPFIDDEGVHDPRLTLRPFSLGNVGIIIDKFPGSHAALVSNEAAQDSILESLRHPLTPDEISTGSLIGAFESLKLKRDVRMRLGNFVSDPVDAFLTDAHGNRLGYSEETGGIAEIPGSIWFGEANGIGWIAGPVDGPLVLEMTGIGEDYFVQVSTLSPAGLNGIEDEGFLEPGQTKVIDVPDAIVVPNIGTAEWNGDDAVGEVGDGSSWSDPNNWSRPDGNIQDVVPNAEPPGDDIVFKLSPNVGTIDLESPRTVNSLSFEAGYTLENHTLTVTTGNIAVQAGVTASIASDIISPVGITKTDEGTLYVTGAAPEVEVAAGTFILGSTGSVNALEIGAAATSVLNGPVLGDLVNNGTLIPSGDFNGDSALRAEDIDALFSMLSATVPQVDPRYDLVSDFVIDEQDVHRLVEEIMGKRWGDADLDGDVDLVDYHSLATHFDPTGRSMDHGWARGDFDGDGDIDIRDFKTTVMNYSPLGYASRPSLNSVVDKEAASAVAIISVENEGVSIINEQDQHGGRLGRRGTREWSKTWSQRGDLLDELGERLKD